MDRITELNIKIYTTRHWKQVSSKGQVISHLLNFLLVFRCQSSTLRSRNKFEISRMCKTYTIYIVQTVCYGLTLNMKRHIQMMCEPNCTSIDKKMTEKNGLFVVFEEVNGAGKSTQISMLGAALTAAGYNTATISFKKRPIKNDLDLIVANYVSGLLKLRVEAGHLLFGARRFNEKELCAANLLTNDVLLVDRYIYSGIAYSIGVYGLDQERCERIKSCLMEPDTVFWLDLDTVISRKRILKQTRGSMIESCETIERINCVLRRFYFNNTSQ